MVPMKRLALKKKIRDECEHNQRNHLLYHLQLHQGKRTAISLETNTVGWNLHAVFGKGDNPGEGDDAD